MQNSKRSGGRPPVFVGENALIRIAGMVTRKHKAKVRRVGHGNDSAGLRTCIDAYPEKAADDSQEAGTR